MHQLPNFYDWRQSFVGTIERKGKRERANCAGPEKIHDSAKLSPRMMDIFKVVGLLKASLGSL